MNSRLLKTVAFFLVINITTEIVFPTMAYALTGGPSQPEVQSFQPASASDMVDPFSGDFSYNIPLLDVGGYPINIAYSSSISMDQEASWVGLGWNVNLGAINRSVRGLPDDFKGERVTKTLNVKPNNTYGINVTPNIQIFGLDKGKKAKGDLNKARISVGLSYNNYSGYGFDLSAQPSISAAEGSKGSLNVGLGLSAGSESGVGITPNVSYSAALESKGDYDKKLTTSIGVPFNSRSGLTALTMSSTVSFKYLPDGDKDKRTLSHNGGGQISFATPSYTPSISLPMNSFALSFSATVGSEFLGLHGNLELGGYYSRQALADKVRATPAYGYLYAHESEKFAQGNVLLDFNREKDGSFSKSTPNLGLANHTYDVYSVQGQGVGGSYRPFRGDVGTVFDAYTTTNGSSTQLPGIELGAGNAAHIGTNFTFVKSNSHSGRWNSNNEAKNFFAFKPENPADKSYEPVYFKQAGEKTADTDPAWFEGVGAFEPVRVELGSKDPGSSRAALITGNNQRLPLSTEASARRRRVSRNQVIAQMNAQEASVGALETQFFSYQAGNFAMDENGRYTAKTALERKGEHRVAHHISEMTVARPDGTRYVYGVPIYNKLQKEVTMAVSGTPDCATGLVPYTTTEASTDNPSGADNYFEEVKTPPYATGFLLSAIVSSDYADVTGDGPSDDDLGTYTRFNYSRVSTDYKWRVPFEANMANYSEGLKSDPYDDKGNYVYGEKELWYVHSVETKTHVAEFYISNREDGFGVSSERGGRGPQTTQKLDKIVLYSKPDRAKEKSGSSPGYVAQPIKTVHFVYDYLLCPGISNSSTAKGKLTLREVFFTYQNSLKGKFSPYEFHYDGLNPSYNLKGYDRWGNFKPNAQGGACGLEDVTAGEFPYVVQNKLLADQYASAWQMTSIDLPSGGKVKVDFESDDYAYVQDKKAGQMFTVTGISNSATSSPVSGRNLKGNRFVHFKLQEPLPASLTATGASDFIKKYYIGDLLTSVMYFRFFVDLDGKGNHDFVPGYSKIVNAGVSPGSLSNGFYTHGYVELKGVGTKPNDNNGSVNPIGKAAWQFTRLQRPVLLFGDESPPGDLNVVGIFKSMISTGRQIAGFVVGINNFMDDRGFGRNFVPQKSIIRLYNSNGFKYGGGSRVKRIAMTDEWAALSNNPDEKSFEFGQEYTYSTTIKSGNQTRTISSGVASYEPVLGGDENPFRQPVSFSVDKLLAPSDKYYLEAPFGEMFFPAPQVGYSRVVISNLKHPDVNHHATGYVLNEFYTAKDFPTIVQQTSLATKSFKPNFLLSFLKVDVREFMTASQGYVVELNDMHGKQKAQWVYAEGKADPISGVEYFYKKTSPESNRLDNKVYTANKLIDAEGKNIFAQNVGVDYDVVADMREQESSSQTSGIGGNLDTFFAAVFPGVVPAVIPKMSKEKVRFRSAVVTKVINRYGLIDKVRAHDLGSTVETKNLLYDAATGEILLTQTQNQFDDPIYQFTFPAHWAYAGMGMAYKNVGLSIDASENELYKYFIPGDEVIINNEKGWINYASQWYGVYAFNRDGQDMPIAGKIKVIRSGRRNQQTSPVGTISSLKSPLTDITGDGIADVLRFDNLQVLNANAVEFTEQWKQPCECLPDTGRDDETPFNNYLTGEAGNFRMTRSYAYLTDRSHTRTNDNPDVRHDGTFKNFQSFWTPSYPGYDYDWNANQYQWKNTSEITIYNTTGTELENRDALGRYSSAVYGYRQTLPKAVGNNSMHQELGFDGFEDYDQAGCADNHFSFSKSKTNVSEEQAHSGKRSIKVPPKSAVELTKKFLCPGEEEGDDGGGDDGGGGERQQ
jgi:hypothetical protein